LKIAIITSYAFPSSKATGNRVLFFSEALEQIGNIETTIFCAPLDKTGAPLKASEGFDQQEIVSIPHGRFKKGNLIARAYFEAVHSITIWRQVRRRHLDFHVITIPSIQLLLLGLVLPKSKFALDFRDAVWEYLENSGGTKKLAAKFIKVVLRISARRAAFITVTNTSEKESIAAITGKQPLIVPNGISRSKFDLLVNLEDFDVQKNLATITYIGNVGIAQGLDTFVRAARSEKDYTFNVVGDGAKLDELREYKKTKNIENLNFLGLLEWPAVVEQIEKSDVLFAQITSEFSSAIPTKIFEYLASGRFVILGLPEGPAKKLFGQFSGVFIHESNSTQGLVDALAKARCYGGIDVEGNRRLLSQKYVRENYQSVFTDAVSRVLYPKLKQKSLNVI
jgi:glycosyltransferase involved in cell wall biosynthesis